MRSALWLKPTLLGVLAILLVLLVALLDRLIDLPSVQVIKTGSVKDLLRFAAAGMLTITTVTLSVLMLVLSLAAGQASPRTVPELMADRVTQNALSVFIMTLILALTGLSVLEIGAIEGAGVTAMFGVALLLVLLAIKYLVQWIHHVADTLKLNRIIERVHSQAEGVLDDHMAQNWTVDHKAQSYSSNRGHGIKPERAGYVQLVDVRRLDRLAEAEHISLELAVRAGDFVHPAVSVMTVSPKRELATIFWRTSEAWSLSVQNARPRAIPCSASNFWRRSRAGRFRRVSTILNLPSSAQTT